MLNRPIICLTICFSIILSGYIDSWAQLPQECIDAEKQLNLEKKKYLYTQCINTGKLSENESSIYYTKRGSVYEYLGQNKLAIRDYDSAIMTNYKFYDAYIKRGIVHYKIDNYNQSIKDFQKAIELRPNNMKAYNNLAWVLVTSKDPEYRDGKKALALIQTALQISKFDDFRVLDTLAAVYAEIGQFDKAADAQSKSIEIAEDRGEAELLDNLRAALSYYEMNRKYFKENSRNSLIIE